MAYDFTTASSQYLSTASTPVTTWPITMACWFNPKDTATTQALLAVTKGGVAESRFVLIAAAAFGAVVRTNVLDSTNANFAVNSTASYSANTWNHAAGVHSANNSRIAYLNGGNSAQNTATSGSLSGINSINIGAQNINSLQTLANALIAEVGIWNVALTAAEIASLAKGMTCDKVRPQSLVFYAPLVRDLQDVRGGLTITNNNTATVANHPRVYA
jgi:hypothetical protein